MDPQSPETEIFNSPKTEEGPKPEDPTNPIYNSLSTRTEITRAYLKAKYGDKIKDENPSVMAKFQLGLDDKGLDDFDQAINNISTNKLGVKITG